MLHHFCTCWVYFSLFSATIKHCDWHPFLKFYHFCVKLLAFALARLVSRVSSVALKCPNHLHPQSYVPTHELPKDTSTWSYFMRVIIFFYFILPISIIMPISYWCSHHLATMCCHCFSRSAQGSPISIPRFLPLTFVMLGFHRRGWRTNWFPM